MAADTETRGALFAGSGAPAARTPVTQERRAGHARERSVPGALAIPRNAGGRALDTGTRNAAAGDATTSTAAPSTAQRIRLALTSCRGRFLLLAVRGDFGGLLRRLRMACAPPAGAHYDVNPDSSVSSLPPSALEHGGINTTWCWSESCNGVVEAHARVMALEQQRARGMRVEPSALAAALQRMGLVAVQSGVFDQAVAAYDRLLALGHDDRTPQWAGAAHGNLGCISLLYAQPDLAYWHFQQEVELARASRDKRWEGRACFKVAKCAEMQEAMAEARRTVCEFLERARDCAEAAGDSEGLARANQHLAAAGVVPGAAQSHASADASATPGASRDPRVLEEGAADRAGGGGSAGDVLAEAAGGAGQAWADRGSWKQGSGLGSRARSRSLPCPRMFLRRRWLCRTCSTAHGRWWCRVARAVEARGGKGSRAGCCRC